MKGVQECSGDCSWEWNAKGHQIGVVGLCRDMVAEAGALSRCTHCKYSYIVAQLKDEPQPCFHGEKKTSE
jgi:hypothetical protein